MELGTALPFPPTDGVTVCRFSPVSDYLLVAAWDSYLRLYDVHRSICLGSLKLSTPILDCNFRDDRSAFSGGLDGQVLSHDFQVEVPPIVLGNHQKPIKCVEYCRDYGTAVSCGWDRLVKFWDPRRVHNRLPITSFELPAKIYSAAQEGNRLVVATAEKHIFIFDMRNLKEEPMHRETGMQHQTRSVRCFRSGEGYGVTSIEGRVAIDYFDAHSESKKYAFRCHRKKENGVEVIYPVNTIAFHPSRGTFATGGCDRTVALWDGENKKKITSIVGFPTGIASLDFNREGTRLAIASSYTFEEGEKEDTPNQIYIRTIQESDLRSKAK